MNKIKFLMTLTLAIFINSISIAQNTHQAKVNEVLNLGENDIAIITDLETGDSYKTSAYHKEILKNVFSENDATNTLKKVQDLENSWKNKNDISSVYKLNPLLNSTNIGRNSFNYWNSNLIKWAGLLDLNKKYIPTKLHPHVKADIAGRLGGAAIGALAGGVGAGPGGLAGACVGSLVSITMKFLDFAFLKKLIIVFFNLINF